MISLMSNSNLPPHQNQYKIGNHSVASIPDRNRIESSEPLVLPPVSRRESEDVNYSADRSSAITSPSVNPAGYFITHNQEIPDSSYHSSPSRFQFPNLQPSQNPNQLHTTAPPFQHRRISSTSSPHMAIPSLQQAQQAQYYYHQAKQVQASAHSYPPPIQVQSVSQYPNAPQHPQSYGQYVYYQQPQQPAAYPNPMVHGPASSQPGAPQPSMIGPADMPFISGMSMPSNMSPGHSKRKSKQSTTWSAKEDKLLRDLKEVQKLGWREISTFFQDRTPNACQFRWRRIISGTSTGTSIHTLNMQHNNNKKKKSHHSINFLLN